MSDQSLLEKRREQRMRTEWTGVIVADEDSTDVFIWDFTFSGARLVVKDQVPEASRFKLNVDGDGQFDAVQRWREGKNLGVQFENDPKEVMRGIVERFRSLVSTS